MKTVKEWLNEINIQKLIGYYQTMYPAYLDDTRLDETMTIRQCRDLGLSKLQDAVFCQALFPKKSVRIPCF